MSSKRYPEEFMIDAVKQVTNRGYSAPDVVKRLGSPSRPCSGVASTVEVIIRGLGEGVKLRYLNK